MMGARERLPLCGEMQLGDEVIHDGRVLVLRGLDPMSVVDGRAEVEDPATGEWARVPIAEVLPSLPGDRVSRGSG
jgi:hypothetical protein